MSTPNPFGFSVLGVANLNDDLMVAYLKDEIVKEMPGLFAADELVIWKVSISITQRLESSVKDCQLLEQTPLLEAVQLSDIFPDPVPKTLHIMAQMPKNQFSKDLEHLRTHFWGQNRGDAPPQAAIATVGMIDFRYEESLLS